jgi:hypothetical protein
VRLHLGFRPREISITIQSGSSRTRLKIALAPVAGFTATRGGILIVSARSTGAGGSASYVARLRVT